MSTKAATIPLGQFKQYAWPKTVIGRFVARHTIRSATFVALAFSVFVVSKTVGYADAYPTAHDRLVTSALYTNNVGLIALYGAPHHIETVSGFAVWYGLCIGVLLGSIWAYLTATKVFRGEETAGRWELLLTGQTTASQAASNALAGLGLSLALFYAIAAVTLIGIGKMHNINFAAGPALFFALAAVAGAVIFMAVGAFASQLMPTRARAAGLATAIFGMSYLLRAAGDITSAHWLLNITPLGWIEKLQPLYDPQPFWLLPIVGLVVALVAGTIFLAGRRDLGDSYFADHDTAKPHNLLLAGPFTSAIRFTRGSSLSWFTALATLMIFFGALTNTASQAFSGSAAAQHLIDQLVKASQETVARTFLGVAYMIAMLLIMSYAASIVGAMRSDEAQGYLDNQLVRPIGRQRWFWSRVGLAFIGLLAASMLASLATWLGLAGHHDVISFHDLLIAGLNTLAPAIFTLGSGLVALGLIPRLTSLIAYGVIAWSFVIQLLGSGLNLNHWILDTSIFTHIALSPAIDPKWGNNTVMTIIGLTLILIGAVAFNRRDLANE